VLKMTEEQLKKHFEDNYLRRMTCFDSFDELVDDDTSVQINAPRALMACVAKGHWDGMVEMNELLCKNMEEKERLVSHIEKLEDRISMLASPHA